jgi:hypothetical protein
MTNPAIHVVLDPDDSIENQRFLHELRSLERGRVVCELRPDQRNLDWLAGDLLRSLGKRADLAGHGRNATRLWRRTKAWIIGEGINDLFVSRAYLAGPGQWKHLLDLQRETGTRLWLIVQRKQLSRSFRDVLEDAEFAQIDFDAFRRRWARRRKTSQLAHSQGITTPTTREELPLMPASLRVPLVEFPLFRAACRDLLPSDRFDRVDRTYREALASTRRWIAETTPTEASVACYLRGLIADAETLDDVLTRLRGAQVAFFLDWWLLKVDIDALAGARDEDSLSPLTPETVRLLRHYSSTTYPAVALLILAARPSLESLAAATLNDVAADGSVVRLPNEKPMRIPVYARGILATHIAYRQLQDGRRADPLFASRQLRANSKVLTHYKPNGLRQVLNKVAYDTGLALTVRGGATRATEDVSWRRRYGISLQPIERER